MIQELATTNWIGDLSLASLLINLVIGFGISLVLAWHFRKFGSSLSNREELAAVFPFITMTTILIITVVKSSLALSLGLVGALSIVRFRTPIKEPEELAYLFLAIGVGLGLGAGQTGATILASLTILIGMVLIGHRRFASDTKNLFLAIEMENFGDEDSKRKIQQISSVISSHALSTDLRRFDVRDQHLEAAYQVDIASPEYLGALVDELRDTFPSVGITFLDQNKLTHV